MKTLGWRVFLIAVVLSLAVSIYLSMQPQAVDVDVAQVQRGPLVVTIRDDGRTRIRERYVVSAPLSGRLVRITLDPGDEVKAGETVLTTIEPTDASLLDPRAVAQAEARVRAAEARSNRARPRLESARIALDHAETEMGRLQKLAESDSGSQQDLDAGIVVFRTAGNDYEAAAFEQDIARFELEVARAALTQAGQVGALEKGPEGGGGSSQSWAFPVQSPISGRVLRVFQESSTVVQAGERILEIGDASDLEVEADILSTEAVRIKPGARVIIDQWGGNAALSGRVRLVEPSAFTKVSALGIEEQRVNVIIDFADEHKELPRLGDGFRVEASIVEWESEDVLIVPTGSLFRVDDSWAVFALLNDRSELTKVSLGHRNDDFAQVLDGLQSGDRVVLYPGDRVEHGAKLKVRLATES